ncbi:Protein RTF2 [Balamuthia mandrillaris]
MGADGGSIPSRAELVKLKKKAERNPPTELERTRWQSCALSKEPLRDPIVCCPLGYLFNKEALITHLLEKSLPSEFSHIRSLKDVIPVHFAANPHYQEAASSAVAADVSSGNGEAPFACPITGLEVNGLYKFSVLRTCGCVFSKRALREVPSTECLQCGKAYTPDDVMPLNGTAEQVEGLRQQLEEKRGQEQVDRKERKRKRKEKKSTDKEKKDKEKTKSKTEKSKSSKRARAPAPSSSSSTSTSSTKSTTTGDAYVSDAYRSIFTSSTKPKTGFTTLTSSYV